MRRKITSTTVTKRLRVSQEFDARGQITAEGILTPMQHADHELWAQFFDEFKDEMGPNDNWDWEHLDPTDFQIHIGGTRRAYEELGTVLLTLVRAKSLSPSYSIDFDLQVIHADGTVHFRIHPPVVDANQVTEFARSRGATKLWVSKDGKTTVDLTARKRRAR